MSKIAIVTDSTANIPQSIMSDYPISVVPLQVIWNGDVYRDSVDITPSEFYTRLYNAKVMPTTSQATPEDLKKVYAGLLEQDYEILSLHISSKLSGTLDSAIQAKAAFPGAPIELVDTLSTAMALGFEVLAAAQAAKQGATLQECKTLVENAKARTGVFFVVSTLEFLHRGGRIGGASAFLGTALNLKPILTLRDGKIEAIERVRTMSKALDRLLDLVEKEIGDRRPIRISSLHAMAPKEADMLLERFRQRFSLSDVDIAIPSEVSPVIGTHTGPGTVGLAYMVGM